jgi:hypothetical protein
MIIGVPREMKNHENRVGLTPAGTHELVKRGHQVLELQQITRVFLLIFFDCKKEIVYECQKKITKISTSSYY